MYSPSTEAEDRGRKFHHYQEIESLTEYLLVASDRIDVDLFQRQAGGYWLLKSASAMEDVVELESLGCRLTLSEVYENVEFEAD